MEFLKMNLPILSVPSARHLSWHELEFYGFIHFTINTFTDKEWGYGDESPALFNPTDFSAEQIVSTAADAGMKGLILTCKHHDGFCLWPSTYTEHSVKNSPWKHGKGDMVAEISQVCAKFNIKFGVYLSPWDRNHADYGNPAYIEYFRNQLNELTSNYGELFEVWFDGANGGDGYYGGVNEARQIDRKHYYDWEHSWGIVRRNQPNAVIFSDAGPDVRWVGNEEGIAGNPCWSTLSKKGFYPGMGGDGGIVYEAENMIAAWGSDQDMLNQGDRNGNDWLPAECDVSIRPGWFYHAIEDEQVRTPENLFNLYLKSVGRGASFLLNLPPDRTGRINQNDIKSLQGFKAKLNAFDASNIVATARITASNTRDGSELFAVNNLIDGNSVSYWTTDDEVLDAVIELKFSEPKNFNVIGLREFLPLGQRVDSFTIEVNDGTGWRIIAEAEAIGNRRLIELGAQCASGIKISLYSTRACPAISELGIYCT
jgi:alpha-L-fucosidase